MATLLPEGKQSFTDGAGMPLVGGKLYTYDAGTSTPRPTYSDAAGTIPNTNPVVLDARGEATVFWQGAYKAVLKDASGVTVWTVDHVLDGGAALALDLLDTAPGNGAVLVGSNDGAGGTLWTTVAGFIAKVVSSDGASIVGTTAHTFNKLSQALGAIDWVAQERPNGVNALSYLPPSEWPAILAKTSTFDCTAHLQAWVDSFATHKSKLFLPTGRYRITAPLNLRLASLTNADMLTIVGDGDLNSNIWLDNNAAAGIFTYDNGWVAFDVANCATTSGSAVVTTTGNFTTAGVVAGCSVTVAGLPACNVVSKDSDTQITVDRTASATASGLTARCYNTIAAPKNRLRLKNLYLTHSQSVTPKTSWHAGTAMKFNGVANSHFENIRINGFTRGIETLGGWINTLRGVLVNGCKEGIYCELPAYRWVFDACSTVNSGGASANWAGIKLINGGGIDFRSHICEKDNIGVELQGVRGWTWQGGNVESVSYAQFLILKGLPWAVADERHWTQAGEISGLRIYNSLGVIMANGVKGIRIRSNTFDLSNPAFTPNGQSWIRTSGESNLVKDVDESGNVFPSGYESITHILAPAGFATLAMCQSITRNGLRYSSGAPYYGKYWQKGDRLYRQPADVLAGSYEGWLCTAASSGADGSATWKQFGTVQA